MSAPILSHWRKAIALGFAVLPTGMVAALDPPLLPLANVAAPVGDEEQEVELYYGTVKVGPTVRPSRSVGLLSSPIVPAEAKSSSLAPAEVGSSPLAPNASIRDAMVDTLHAVRDGTRKVSDAAAGYLTRAEERAKTSAEPRTFVLANPTSQLLPGSATPGAAQAAASSSQPTVVIIRDSSNDARPAPAAETGGITIGTGTLWGLGLGTLGIGLGYVGLRRRMVAMATMAPPVPPDHPENSVLLMGKYNAGPRRESAEKFEIGPTYKVVQEEKKKTETEKQQAVLELILSQNLALHGAIADLGDSPAAEALLPVAEPVIDDVPLPAAA